MVDVQVQDYFLVDPCIWDSQNAIIEFALVELRFLKILEIKFSKMIKKVLKKKKKLKIYKIFPDF